MGKTKICLSFWSRKGRANRIRRRRREEKKEEGRIKKRKGKKKYGFLYTSMDAMVCIELIWKNQTINPFFFFMILGLK